jgi:hypothetical protein
MAVNLSMAFPLNSTDKAFDQPPVDQPLRVIAAPLARLS